MSAFLSRAEALLSTAEKQRHRVLIAVAGERSWGEQCALQCLQLRPWKPLWLSEQTSAWPHATNANDSRRYLGREVDALVFDAHSGFDPNVFALLCGTVRAGGALILLCPPLAHWAEHADPVNQRCSVWGQTIMHSRYLDRLARVLASQCQLLLQQPGQIHSTAMPIAAPTENALSEQTTAVRSLAEAYGVGQPLLGVISGDRGRGKSAALGQLAAALAAVGVRDILITAPRKAAVHELLAQAQAHWPANAPLWSQCLRFEPPDRLAAQTLPCEVLLLDEMGGIHLRLLEAMLSRYPRLLMAGTVHGYEGAGRGFHTRLRRLIQRDYAHCQWRQLSQPIRWADKDPLERAVYRLMMLDANADDGAAQHPQFEWLDRDLLSRDEPLLRSVFGVLAAAHYRTRPLDLRQILDGPNLRLAVLRCDNQVLAAALLAVEGPLPDPQLVARIMAAERRPAGHLLPQILLQRRQLRAAADLSFWRVVRIAVQPEQQGRGHGSRLLAELNRAAAAAAVDCLGSTFAVDAAVLRFWRRGGYQPVLLGDKREATSGSYALTVLRPLSAAAKTLGHSAQEAWVQAQRATLESTHPDLPPQLLGDLQRDAAGANEVQNVKIER